MLVIHNGKTVYEEYHAGFTASNQNLLASGTKSFCGVAALLAVQDGLLKLDERVSDTITEWKSDPRSSKVTIRQLLNLTSGVPGGRIGSPSFEEAVRARATAEPGKVFQYGPNAFQIFGELMNRKLRSLRDARGMSFEGYVRVRILNPIGMESMKWRRVYDGNPQSAGGASATAREWARFGEFVRLKGKAGGEQIIKPELFRELGIGTKANPAYGLTWWLNKQATSRGGRQQLTADHPDAFMLKEDRATCWLRPALGGRGCT